MPCLAYHGPTRNPPRATWHTQSAPRCPHAGPTLPSPYPSRLEALEHGAAAEKLHKYEIAALFNLIQTDSEASEATELIPSLKRFDSEFIEQQVLEACQKEMEELMI